MRASTNGKRLLLILNGTVLWYSVAIVKLMCQNLPTTATKRDTSTLYRTTGSD